MTGISQLHITPVPRGLMPSSGLHRHWIPCNRHTDTDIYTEIKHLWESYSDVTSDMLAICSSSLFSPPVPSLLLLFPLNSSLLYSPPLLIVTPFPSLFFSPPIFSAKDGFCQLAAIWTSGSGIVYKNVILYDIYIIQYLYNICNS